MEKAFGWLHLDDEPGISKWKDNSPAYLIL